MNLTKTLILLAAVSVIYSCKTSKNTVNTSPVATVPAQASPNSTIAFSVPPPKPPVDFHTPGEIELSAIKEKYSDLTIEHLQNGHAIYTGVCTNCHEAKSIYARPEERWSSIINDMAPMAGISEEQKDAVLKYVLSIKASQGK